MKTQTSKPVRAVPLAPGVGARPSVVAPPSAPAGSRIGANPQTRSAAQFWCRMVDVTISSAMLAVLAVPMLVIAALVKLTSRGPALYRQQRIGLGGRPFVIYKFRTMGTDAEVATGPVWATRGDVRCTVIGHVLRRWCLDELPQLFNVLKGEMSLVGPRPERPYFVKEFSLQYAGYADRHRVLPGMTGWAQVNGWRGDSSLEKRIEFDLYYVRNWSPWFNLRIILLTPFRLLIDRHGG
jgi:exopolysaccharide biosynthesis polyprenyl glycosylphosphotransferase